MDYHKKRKALIGATTARGIAAIFATGGLAAPIVAMAMGAAAAGAWGYNKVSEQEHDEENKQRKEKMRDLPARIPPSEIYPTSSYRGYENMPILQQTENPLSTIGRTKPNLATKIIDNMNHINTHESIASQITETMRQNSRDKAEFSFKGSGGYKFKGKVKLK